MSRPSKRLQYKIQSKAPAFEEDSDFRRESSTDEDEIGGSSIASSEKDESESSEDLGEEIDRSDESGVGLTFGELAEKRDRMGKKAFEVSMRDSKANEKKAALKRDNKHAPMEMSSKRPVSRKRTVVEVAASKRRDPRFDHLSGSFNKDLFDKAYGFLGEVKAQEKAALQRELAAARNPAQAAELTQTLQAMNNRERAERERDQKQRIKREWRKQEASRIKEGKMPFFLKKSETKKLMLIAKTKGKSDRELERLAEKKRKRDAGKDRKFVPRRRRTEEASE